MGPKPVTLESIHCSWIMLLGQRDVPDVAQHWYIEVGLPLSVFRSFLGSVHEKGGVAANDGPLFGKPIARVGKCRFLTEISKPIEELHGSADMKW